jgi:hypothetical protein
MKPEVVLKQNIVNLNTNSLPFIAPIPKPLRNFCAFVFVENDTEAHCGSGTITKDGVITVAHLFAFDWQRALVTFYVDDCHYITIPVVRISLLDPEDDLAILSVNLSPIKNNLPSVQKPTSLEWNKARVIAFGCPQAVFGYTWKPTAWTLGYRHIISRGVLIPGISGGGLFVEHQGKWYLWGVHSFGYPDSKTLYSFKFW